MSSENRLAGFTMPKSSYIQFVLIKFHFNFRFVIILIFVNCTIEIIIEAVGIVLGLSLEGL